MWYLVFFCQSSVLQNVGMDVAANEKAVHKDFFNGKLFSVFIKLAQQIKCHHHEFYRFSGSL